MDNIPFEEIETVDTTIPEIARVIAKNYSKNGEIKDEHADDSWLYFQLVYDEEDGDVHYSTIDDELVFGESIGMVYRNRQP